MMKGSFDFRRPITGAVAVLAFALSACGPDDGNGGSTPAPAPAPTPTPTPTPTPAPTATPAATAAPFGLTTSRTFEILGWDLDASGQRVPSAVQLRWNASSGKYEVLAPGYTDWARLEPKPATAGATPTYLDVFAADGTELPFDMFIAAPPQSFPQNGFIGDARIIKSSVSSWVLFGIATATGDVPTTGTKKCDFGMDEIGGGQVTFDLAGGTVSGFVEPFWAKDHYVLTQTSFAQGATTFTARFGADGVLEGRFFGPHGVNLAVRAIGGGTGFSAVNGVMIGTCDG